MYIDNVPWLVNGWWDFCHHGVILKSSSNENNPLQEYFEKQHGDERVKRHQIHMYHGRGSVVDLGNEVVGLVEVKPTP